MHLRILQKDKFKRQQIQLVICLVKKLLRELRKFQHNSQQNHSNTVANELDKEIPKGRYIYIYIYIYISTMCAFIPPKKKLLMI